MRSRYSSSSGAHSSNDRPRRSRAPADARSSASLPRISMWPSSSVRHEDAVDEQRRPDAGAQGEQQHHALHARARRRSGSRRRRPASASLRTTQGRPMASREELRRRRADPGSGRCWRPSSPCRRRSRRGTPMPTGPASGAEAGDQRRPWPPPRRPGRPAAASPRAPARRSARRGAESTTPALMPDPADVDADQTPHRLAPPRCRR